MRPDEIGDIGPGRRLPGLFRARNSSKSPSVNLTEIFLLFGTGSNGSDVDGLLRLRTQVEFEVKVPELDTSVFIIPASRVKNGEERLMVLNRIARSVIESMRGKHAEFVFVRKGKHEIASPIRGLSTPPGSERANGLPIGGALY